jgi:hypothetical protein
MFLHVRGIVTYQQKISVWCVGQLRFRTVKLTERRVSPKQKYFQSFPGGETKKKISLKKTHQLFSNSGPLFQRPEEVAPRSPCEDFRIPHSAKRASRMRAADTGVPLKRARVSPIHQCPRTSWIRNITSVLSRPGSMRVRAKGTTAPRDFPTCAPAISSCFGVSPPTEGGKMCKMRTTRERAMRSNAAKPTPSVRWPRQRPARCQVGRRMGASPRFSGGKVHFVHVNSVIVELILMVIMRGRDT